jgi:hypothetical protein
MSITLKAAAKGKGYQTVHHRQLNYRRNRILCFSSPTARHCSPFRSPPGHITEEARKNVTAQK